MEPGPTVPLPPSVEEVVDRTTNSITLVISTRRDADNHLHRSTTSDGDYVLVASNLGGERHLDDGLQPSTTYFYRMQACNDIGCSDLSRGAIGGITEAEGTVSVPSVPRNVEGHKVDRFWEPDDAAVTWDAVDGATYYEVYQGSNLEVVVSAPLTRYTDTEPNQFRGGGLAVSSYSVKACNKAGCSDFSASAVVR